MSELTRVELQNGIALDVWDSGPRDAPALIFLHGFPENHRTWRHQIEHLNTRFRCIAPDQRGYGNSSRPEGVEHYDPQALVGDIVALAGALDVAEFTVVGHDWGGALAWGIAALGQATGLVTRAVIANAPHPAVFQRLLLTDRAQREASQYMRTFRDPANDALVREHGLGALLQQALSWTDRPDYDPAELAVLMEQWSDPDRAIAMLNWYRASGIGVPGMDDPYADPADVTPPPFPRLDIPTLVIWGMDDEALLPANIEGLDEWVSDLTIQRVPDAGHFVPWEAPDPVNAAMARFLEKTA
ncbi:alpha/beta fold hydrolase [Aurantiacibacter gangjinensis]|uniref:Alpha/beta hydrolase n=1 Tax=Aurantiacibacter gangjinensis TaxID=502682 RepID=A0A0G9MRV7_9SPHN|nr:alpha/beta hydrolase [Aurantiacibacter gangjinensis]APE29223.1 Alpha/beta hydrolase fold [Aurantiacibacter gangjinensis]KLE33279.1 alpha/beta hydrolase [Aurantiacibacter gangjinensis]